VTTAREWVAGARPKTLPAAVAPVAVGTGAAYEVGGAVAWKALLCLVVALALQVGVNYANDYSDGVRGTDADRVGPLRLVGSGAASAPAVRRAAFAAFGVAAVAGLVLAATSTWWFLAIGAAAIAAAWLYTGGPRPYGYAGLGEVFVFVFFGLVAVLGTMWAQAGEVTLSAIAGAVGCGLLAVAVLVANNLRDLPRDAKAGKRTLAVRLGDRHTRTLYVTCVFVPYALAALLVGPGRVGVALPLLSLPLAMIAADRVRKGAAGPALVPVLAKTGQALLAYGLLLGLGLALAA